MFVFCIVDTHIEQFSSQIKTEVFIKFVTILYTRVVSKPLWKVLRKSILLYLIIQWKSVNLAALINIYMGYK